MHVKHRLTTSVGVLLWVPSCHHPTCFSWGLQLNPLTCYSPLPSCNSKGCICCFLFSQLQLHPRVITRDVLYSSQLQHQPPESQLEMLVVFHLSCNSAHESQLDRGVLFVVAPVATQASSRNSGGGGGVCCCFVCY